jgi:hypothetical protein
MSGLVFAAADEFDFAERLGGVERRASPARSQSSAGLPMASVKDHVSRFGLNLDTARHISADDYRQLSFGKAVKPLPW